MFVGLVDYACTVHGPKILNRLIFEIQTLKKQHRDERYGTLVPPDSLGKLLVAFFFFFFDILSLCSVQNYETRPTNFARNHEKARSLSLLVTQCMERYKMKTTCQPTKDLPESA